jgi:hypothetical protein
MDKFEQLCHLSGRLLGSRTWLYLDVDVGSAPKFLKNINEPWDALTGEAGAEPRSGIKLSNLIKRAFGNEPRAIGSALERVIMKHHHLPVFGVLYIDLHHGGTALESHNDSRHRVLRCNARGSTMGADNEGIFFNELVERDHQGCSDGNSENEPLDKPR